jgi:hypothetical protein
MKISEHAAMVSKRMNITEACSNQNFYVYVYINIYLVKI